MSVRAAGSGPMAIRRVSPPVDPLPFCGVGAHRVDLRRTAEESKTVKEPYNRYLLLARPGSRSSRTARARTAPERMAREAGKAEERGDRDHIQLLGWDRSPKDGRGELMLDGRTIDES